ncbi:MAG: thermonuclease family protein [Aeromicrobium sp.]|uniref:thermonuclease family protein n=1 Tax=Aeromicrobium sp. TaxID=1871063 RepID=UPI0039E2877A
MHHQPTSRRTAGAVWSMVWRVPAIAFMGLLILVTLLFAADRETWFGPAWVKAMVLLGFLLAFGGCAHIISVWARQIIVIATSPAAWAHAGKTGIYGWWLALAVICSPISAVAEAYAPGPDDPTEPSTAAGAAGAAFLFFLIWSGYLACRIYQGRAPWPLRWARGVRGLVRVGIPMGGVTALLLSFVVAVSPASAQEATVERVVDGDTVDVTVEGVEKRVRLLNIDTPETVDPNQPKECLGDEATTYTNSLLASGDKVTLEFDRERTDKYGRTLAHIKLDDGRYVSDEIARQGLGAPVVFGDNDRRIDDVRSAAREAADEQRGHFDPAVDCTLAYRVQQAETALADALVVQEGTSAAEAAAAAAAVIAVVEAQSALRDLLNDIDTSADLAIRAYREAGRTPALAGLRETFDEAAARHAALTTLVGERQAAESAAAEEAQRAAEEAARRAAEEAAQREAERSTPDQPSAGGGGGDPYPGYTGCREYAPGGQSWKPIPCP